MGGTCATHDDCMPGHACFDVAGASTCFRFCEATPDCADGSPCVALSGGGLPVGACGIACDVVGDTGCRAGLACAAGINTDLVTGAMVWWTFCGPPGTVAEGAACGTMARCTPGHICDRGFCRRFCDVAAPVCGAGTACAVLSSPPFTLLGHTYGLCG